MSVLFIMRSTFRNADARDCVGWKGIRSRASLLSSELSWLSRKLSQCIRYEKPLTASRIANHSHSCQQVTSASGKQLLHVQSCSSRLCLAEDLPSLEFVWTEIHSKTKRTKLWHKKSHITPYRKPSKCLTERKGRVGAHNLGSFLARNNLVLNVVLRVSGRRLNLSSSSLFAAHAEKIVDIVLENALKEHGNT